MTHASLRPHVWRGSHQVQESHLHPKNHRPINTAAPLPHPKKSKPSLRKLTWLAGISPCLIADTSFKWLSFLCHVSFRGCTLPKMNRCPKKWNHFQKEISSSNYHFSGSMLGFRGVSLSGPQELQLQGGDCWFCVLNFGSPLSKGLYIQQPAVSETGKDAT